MSLKEVAAMKSMLASTAVLVTFCAAPAVSAEFPKAGERRGRRAKRNRSVAQMGFVDRVAIV